MIRSISSRFGVISIAGMYRTGKSYLLNKMLLNKSRDLKGFQVGKTVNACTKGLWIYNKPIIGIDQEGENIPVFIIDTEGLGSLDEDINHDLKIFTLAVLLSSCFIYNSIGSIDQSSIESLNYIVNLSKFLQVKSNDSNEGFFPNFLWILRDFSLQLKDKDTMLTPKVFMETALNNFKNAHIQDTIKKYFPERDCCTIVRPVIDENDIQNLDSLPDEKLRTEFIEQIILLRKRILHRCKVKKFRGKEINGEQFIAIVQSYLDMLNKGLIPSIDSIWNSLCKTEGNKASELAEKEYEKSFKDCVINTSMKYFDQDELKNIHAKSKESALNLFTSKSIGDSEILLPYLQDLKKKIKERYNYFKSVNEEELRNNIMKLLKMRFEVIEFKLKSKEIKSFAEIENQLNNVERDLNASYEDSSLKTELILDFKVKLLLYAGSYISSNLEQNFESKMEENKERTEKISSELNEVKEKSEKENKRKEITIDEISKDNSLLRTEISNVKEKLTNEENEGSLKVKLISDKLNDLRKEFTKENEDLKAKLSVVEEAKKKAERKCINVQADFDQEKALLDMKIEHLNKSLEESSRREKTSGNDSRTQLKEQQNALKETTTKNEKIIKDLATQIEQLKEKIFDLESNLSHKDNINELELIKAEENLTKISNERDSLNDKLTVLKKKIEEEKEKNKTDSENKNKENQNLTNLLKSKEEEHCLKFKTMEEELSKKNIKIEREFLILKQTNEFLEVKCLELSSQLNDQKINLEKMIKALEDKLHETEILNEEELNHRLEEIKSNYESEKRQIEISFEKDKDSFKKDSKSLQEKLNMKSITELENENLISSLKSELFKVNSHNENLNNEKSLLEEAYRNSQNEYMRKVRELNEEFSRHLEEKERHFQSEMKNLNINSEDSVSQFKSLFEIEKMRLEDKIKEEKLKNDNKVKYLNEEHENKIREQEKEFREEIDNLQDELNLLQNDHQNYVYNAEHEVILQNQKINSLENSLRESKETISLMQSQFNQTLDSKTESFNQERKELLNKIEELRNENTKREKEISNLLLKKEVLEKSLYENEQSYNKQRRDLEEDLRELNFKYENFRTKQQEVVDELTIQKLEYTRETALLKQQIEFLNTKLEEQSRINEENQREYEENLNSFKEELISEYNDKLDCVQREKEETVDKLNKKKKELRDLEQTFLKQSCMAEKEKNSLTEKIQLLDARKREMIDNYQMDLEKLSQDMINMKSEYYKELDAYQTANEELKNKIRELQNTLSDKIESFETAKNLLEGKLKLVEKQKEEYKKELIETQSKAEKIFEAFQKKLSAEKSQIENLYQDKLKEVENKYQTLIKNLKESHQNINSEMVLYIQELEKELKSLSIQAELKTRTLTDPTAVNQKVVDLIEEVNKLKKELEETKLEKTKKLSESLCMSEREKELLRLKINDAEQKYKEAEGKRGLLMIEYEKERSRWSLERDHYHSNVMELQETIDRLQRKVENLLREIEKIKSDKEKDKDKEVVHKKFNNLLTFSTNNINSNLILGNKSHIDNEISSIDFNKPRIYNKSQINSTNNSKVLINEDFMSSDKFDFIFNNNKSASKLQSSSNKKTK